MTLSKNKAQKNSQSKTHSWKTIATVDDDLKACDHYFEFVDGGAECKKCSTGLMGVYEIDDGKPVI